MSNQLASELERVLAERGVHRLAERGVHRHGYSREQAIERGAAWIQQCDSFYQDDREYAYAQMRLLARELLALLTDGAAHSQSVPRP